MTRRKLPIGIQSFRTIREGDFYYVDKTPLVRQLAQQGRFYFLSRPRRFGKSLLLDTLKALFQGNEDLFRGLDIHPHWDWAIQHPVVRLSFGGNYSEPGNLHSNAVSQLAMIEEDAGLEAGGELHRTGPAPESAPPPPPHHRTAGGGAGGRIRQAHPGRTGKSGAGQGQPGLAAGLLRHRQGQRRARPLRLRYRGEHVLQGEPLLRPQQPGGRQPGSPIRHRLRLHRQRSGPSVCTGAGGLEREEIRRWYNGYHWLGEEKVYNPFDVLLLLRKRKFKPWWFETGSPSFLFQQLMDKGVSPMELERRVTDEQLVSKFDVGDISVDALLFQTGYLTLTGEERKGAQTFYTLDYPNLEVRQSLNQGLLSHLGRQGKETYDQGKELARLLADNDFDGFAAHLRAFFAGIPYPWHSKGDMARYEAWYAGMLYACFRTIGLDLRVEDASSRGRSDMVLLHGGQVFVLEFKVAREQGGTDNTEHLLHKAIQQMREKGYGEKYRHREEPIHLVALVFGWQNRNLDAVKAVRA